MGGGRGYMIKTVGCRVEQPWLEVKNWAQSSSSQWLAAGTYSFGLHSQRSGHEALLSFEGYWASEAAHPPQAVQGPR